ncbi:hypothetical protein C1Y63_03610 [Corynebacterium sp. 13CS0277]|uniref:hypothetical protein n=1 Tax=Corynebacterium sp. 13CS0277 TaxID=2071994 RepID=UPI000D031151|nr:hypothetical protein [Corynebacterium sp. 13CS0277]PRQ11951.1 hypothetical protein C1Y63_03610 [Corynebacterium sp. 13CS0277]
MSEHTAPVIREVTMERVREVMRTFNVELSEPRQMEFQGAVVSGVNLNNFDVHFIVMGGYLLVRADHPTGEKTEDGDPGLFLAAHTVNSSSPLPKSVILDRTPELIVRTEVEMIIGAGMTDEQLHTYLGAAIDGVLEAQDKVAQVRAAYAQQAGGAAPAGQ